MRHDLPKLFGNTLKSFASRAFLGSAIGSGRCDNFRVMTLSAEHLSPIVALIAGILILILPSLLNYVVAIYLIVTGLIGLNGIYHFIS
jgi:hypothetical protein